MTKKPTKPDYALKAQAMAFDEKYHDSTNCLRGFEYDEFERAKKSISDFELGDFEYYCRAFCLGISWLKGCTNISYKLG